MPSPMNRTGRSSGEDTPRSPHAVTADLSNRASRSASPTRPPGRIPHDGCSIMRNPSRPRLRQARPNSGRVRPSLERCEPRLLLTTYTVTTIADDGDGSLRAAIQQVNNDSTPDVITFAIPGGGPQVIKLASSLDPIENTVTIDGTTQQGYAGTPLVSIDGSLAGPFSGDGLTIQANDTIVQGLGILNSGGNGISISGLGATGNCVIRGDYIGVDPASLATAPNQGDGVLLLGAPNNVIGQPGAGNVIGGNTGDGIDVSAGSTNELIQSNFIGISRARSEIGLGPIRISNGLDGIFLQGATAVTVGGTAAGAGNVISFNSSFAVFVSGGSGNLFQGNLIGTDPTGLLARGNGSGVHVEASTDNTIGGSAAGAGNVISANTGDGLAVISASSGNLIEGNSIGVGVDGQAMLGNTGNGILVDGSPGNTIGGAASGSANLIAANGGDGVSLQDVGSPGTVVQGDKIFNNSGNGVSIRGVSSSGTVVQGDQILSNSGEGISILDTPSNAVLNNIIGGNRLDGVAIQAVNASASGNLLQGNFIGTDPSGARVPNQLDGVSILNSGNNTIGGTSSTARNVISANSYNGISLRGPRASKNLVEGNFIGTDPTGTSNLGNLLDGVFIVNAPMNTIGGTVAGARNVISQNRNGIELQTITDAQAGPSAPDLHGGLSDNNLIEGNYIGTDVTGEFVLGNLSDGVLITDGSSNTIGGTAVGAGNVVSNNTADGIGIGMSGSGVDPTTGNLVQGNIIGLDMSGTRRLANGQNGVKLVMAIDATIGGTASGAGNVISGNTTGVDIQGLPGLVLGERPRRGQHRRPRLGWLPARPHDAGRAGAGQHQRRGRHRAGRLRGHDRGDVTGREEHPLR